MYRSIFTTFLPILLTVFLFTACSKKTEVDISMETSGGDTSGGSVTTQQPPPNAMTGPAPSDAISTQDRQFVAQALIGNKVEIELGNMAISKARSASVKEFAQMMVRDHSRAYIELVQIASVKGIQIDTAITAEQMITQEKLMKTSGKQFDRDYISLMVMDHEMARDHFQLEATNGTDPDLKAYAQKYLDAITQHLKHARSMDTVSTLQ